MNTILFDVGGVMVKPATCDWQLGPDYEAVLGADFSQKHLDAFRKARSACLHLLPDANKVDSEDAEYRMFIRYYAEVFDRMGLGLSPGQAEKLAHAQVYRDDRYILFDDVLPTLQRLQGAYRLGIVSDAPPSTRRALTALGVMDFIDAATFSCDIGVLKPQAAIYENTLRLLGSAPQDAMFIDDVPGNLLGAQAIGIRAVQMRREMPEGFAAAPLWDGEVIYGLTGL